VFERAGEGLCPTAVGEPSGKFIIMKHLNHRKLLTLAAISALGLSFLTTGCERTVSRTEETKVKRDGTVESKEKTVTVNPDGTTNKTEIKRTEKP